MILPRSPAVLLIVPVLAVSLLKGVPIANAGPIGLDAFGPEAVLTDFNGLPLETYDNPSPLVIGGDTYTSSDGIFRYLTDYGAGETITTDGDLSTVTVILARDTTRVGASIGAFGASAETVRFYDAMHNLLGTVEVTNPTAGLTFVGWETTGAPIRSVEFQDISVNDFVLALDNLIAESASVPEPGTLALLGLGLAGVVLRRRHAPAR